MYAYRREKDEIMEKDIKVSTRLKLSALWIAVMFFYVYADIKCFFETGMLEKIMTGNIEGLIISKALLFWGAVLMSIPVSMLFLSLILPFKICKYLNIVIAALHIPLAISVLFVGTESWSYYYYYTALEIMVHILIIIHSAKWKLKV